jgi:proteasome regulatory subunit
MDKFDEDFKKGELDSNQDVLYNISYENARLEEENRNLKRTIEFYKIELDKFRTPPFIVSEVVSLQPENRAIVKLPNQSNFLVEISSELKKPINVGDLVLNEQKSLVIIDKVDMNRNYSVENYIIMDKKSNIKWNDIGGLKEEVEKVKEVLELPLLKPKLFKEIGITPPKGVLLYGPPGTGKTMIAKALANQTNATFIELVGSELVQKFIGEGAKLVKDLFELARKKAPTIIFIDELDAIAAKRIETGTSGEREVQRTFMQLLGEIDGFDPLSNVKIIAATNRIDILDEAILRPGRLERHIEIGLPNKEGRKEILNIYISKMKVDKNVDLDKLAELTEGFSGAEIKALTTEAGYIAIREGRKKVTQEDLEKAIKRVKKEEKEYSVMCKSYM